MSISLTTNRLRLQIENESSADKVLQFYTENISYFEPFEPTRPESFYTLEYQEATMRYEQNELELGNALRYYVYLKEDPDTIIGSVNFFRIQPAPFSSASIGYKLHHNFWGNGYATEACAAAITILFSIYNIHRLEARVAPENTASIRLLERMNFTYEGTEQKSVEVQGEFKDHRRYSLLNENYRR